MIYPLVVNNRFKVRLVALERDSPDPDDTANGEFYIDLDTKYPPVSDWRIVAADPRNTDLNLARLRGETNSDCSGPRPRVVIGWPWSGCEGSVRDRAVL